RAEWLQSSSLHWVAKNSLRRGLAARPRYRTNQDPYSPPRVEPCGALSAIIELHYLNTQSGGRGSAHSGALRFFGLGIGVTKLGAATLLDDALGRLAGFVELPMAARILVGRVQDWLVEERVRHRCGDEVPRSRS